MDLKLSVVQFISVLVSLLGSFVAVFFSLQRYVGKRVDEGIDRFDKHATKLESKLDRVVSSLADLSQALARVGERHETKIEAIDGRVDRLDSRLTNIERGGR